MLFEFQGGRELELNPILLGGAAGVALFKETDPAGEKPCGYDSKEPWREQAPCDAERDTFTEPALNEDLHDIHEKKMKRSEEQKPSEWPEISRQEAEMVPERPGKGLAVEDERNLHGSEEKQNGGEQRPCEARAEINGLGLGRKPPGEEWEILQDQRQMDEEGAQHHHDGSPFHDKAESANGKIEQMLVLDGDAADPAVGEKNEINLDAHAEEVFEKKREPFDDGRPLVPDPGGIGILRKTEELRRRVEQGL